MSGPELLALIERRASDDNHYLLSNGQLPAESRYLYEKATDINWDTTREYFRNVDKIDVSTLSIDFMIRGAALFGMTVDEFRRMLEAP